MHRRCDCGGLALIVRRETDAGSEAPKVEVSPGQLPKYDVDTAKVTVDSQKKEVTVPKVTTEEKTITVPDVNVTMPGEQPASPAASPTP